MRTIIAPKGHQLERLRANTGLHRYTVDGPLENSTVALASGQLPVWVFRWTDILEQVVRDHMLKETIGKRNMTSEQAITFLQQTPCAIPQNEVEIEVIRE